MPHSHLQQLERLTFSCCGVLICVEYDRTIRRGQLVTLLPPGAEITTTNSATTHCFQMQLWGDSRYSIQQNSRRRSAPEEPHIALLRLRKSLQHCVAEFAREQTFIHAGVVEWHGSAIVFPGPSFVGKSTLVWALVRAGATYYSDEYAVFDPEGRIHPFSVPISLRLPQGSREELMTDRIGVRPSTPGLLLFATYRTNCVWSPERISAGNAVIALLGNSVSMRRNPNHVLRLLTKVARNTVAWRGERSDTDAVINWLKTFA